MKYARRGCCAVTAMLFFAALAAASGAKRIVVRYDVTIAGSHLASGQYDVQVQTHESSATVSFAKHGNVVAKVEGKVINRGTKYASNEVVYDLVGDGARVLQEIRFKGSSQVLAFE